jgi:ATP-dependent RNA helicase DDX55/SPB4
MPELKKWDGDKTLGVKINMSEYAYKDKAREKARRVAMEEEKTKEPYVPSEEAIRKRKEREAWSHKHEQQDVKEARREKKKRKREAERIEKLTEEEKAKESEVQELVEQVKRKRLEEENDVEFTGFDD